MILKIWQYCFSVSTVSPSAVFCALRHFRLRRQAFRRLITSGYDPARYCRLTAAFLCLTASLPPAVVSPYGDQRSAALSRRSLDEDGWITSGYDPVRYCCLTATFLCLRRFLCLAALSPSATSVPPLDHVRVRPGAILLPYGNFFMPPAVFLCLTELSPPAASVPPLDHVRVRPGAILLPYGNFFMPPAVFVPCGNFYASGGFFVPDGNFFMPSAVFVPDGTFASGGKRSAALSRRSLGEDGWITSGYDPARYCCLTATFMPPAVLLPCGTFASGGFTASNLPKHAKQNCFQ